jgi:YbgC/YbaW family acyl-CoA thioester hydrolase
MPAEIRVTRLVQFHETDAAGLVHFSRFFLYMEEAEHALWRAAGLSNAPRSELGWPRVAASCDYHAPLRYEDEFEITLRVVALTRHTISYGCDITRGALAIATGKLKVACVAKGADGRLAVRQIPDEVATRLG